MNKRLTYGSALLGTLLMISHYCQAEITPMSDSELETITGTGFSVAPTTTGGIDFTFDEKTKDGTPISGSGNLAIEQKETAHNSGEIESTANLSLNDSAQENLRALVNVNSVESAIQVLLNLNVNINSVVGSLDQSNQAQLNP